MDITSDLGDLIANAKTFGSSDNIRCGKYRGLIRRIFAEKVETGRFAFVEMKVLSAQPNPQIVPTGAIVGTQFDDGMKPNLVGSDFAMKVNFDGPGAKSAPGNVRGFILGLFGLKEGEVSPAEVNSTWADFSRTKDLHVGDAIGIENNVVIKADKAKLANPGCGMLVDITASMKEKKKTREIKELAPEKREYVTILKWECVARPGTGENAPDLVAKRRLEIDLPADDDDADVVSTPAAPPAVGSILAQQPATPTPAAAPAPPAPVAPAPPVPVAEFVPTAPWRKHPDQAVGPTPETRWYWDGGAGVKNEADLRAGK